MMEEEVPFLRPESPEIPSIPWSDEWLKKSTVAIPFEADISRGTELYPVSVRNDVDSTTLKPFEYIRDIQILTNYHRTPVVCDCEDGCDSNCKCMYDSYDASHADIPYDKDGRLISMNSKWKGSHRVVWECSADCGCGPECPSRSAQLGCRFPLEVFMTTKKGWGVRPRRDIPKGSFVAEYAGVMKAVQDDTYQFNESDWYSFDINTEDGVTDFYIDASTKGNVARFINHSCDSNLIAVHVFYDDNNEQMGMHICFYAANDITQGTELSFDYGSSYWEAKMKQRIGCACGSVKKCQYRIKVKKGKAKGRRRR